MQVNSASSKALLWIYPFLDIPASWSCGRLGEPQHAVNQYMVVMLGNQHLHAVTIALE